jgi:hypothetical protein
MVVKYLAITILLTAAVTVVVPTATAQTDEGASDKEETLVEEAPGQETKDTRTLGVPYSLQMAFLTMSALVIVGGIGIRLKRYRRNDPFIEQRTQQEPQETTPDEVDPEQVLSTAQVLSKQVLVLLIATLVLSLYLIQRGFAEVITGGIFTVQQPGGQPGGPQLERWGLSFSYLALSVFWPLVLGSCCVAFQMVLLKRHSLLDQLDKPLSSTSPLYSPPIFTTWRGVCLCATPRWCGRGLCP